MQIPDRHHFGSWCGGREQHMLWSLLLPVTDEVSCRFPLIYTIRPQILLSVSLMKCSSGVVGGAEHKMCTQKTGLMAMLLVYHSHLAQHFFLHIETKRTKIIGEKEFIVNITIQCTLQLRGYTSLIDTTVGYSGLEKKIYKNK